MKNITQRKLPLNVNYTVVDKKYIPLVEGFGCTCQNCGKLIANIATVANPDGQRFDIGFDCLETFLMNNNLLSQGDIEDYEKVKKMIPKVLNTAKKIKEVVMANSEVGITITALKFERKSYESDFYTFYWFINNQEKSRDNDYFKIKGMNLDFLVSTLQNIFPKIQFIIN